MDHAAFHIVYVDKRVSKKLDGAYLGDEAATVHVCTSNESCLAKLSQFGSERIDFEPVLVILEASMAIETGGPEMGAVARDTRTHSVAHSSTRRSVVSTASSPLAAHDVNLLRSISSQISKSELSRAIVPIVFVPSPPPAHSDPHNSNTDYPTLSHEFFRCLEDGATDVLFSPLARDCMRCIMSNVYRLRRDKLAIKAAAQEAKKTRKRSWVGIDDRKPYAYLREEMVSSLMTGICSPDQFQPMVDRRSSPVASGNNPLLAKSIAAWDFSAHDFSEDELLQAALLMLQHALSMPELERWRLSAADLNSFLSASRTAYNSFVHYHNFRHVVDVMQAVFYFLLQLGALPPYSQIQTYGPASPRIGSPIGDLLKPFDALTLLISAIGHDVGHPGVNNAFLVALNAPLAQLYNDKSVLESFHCAAYSQILRRHWGSVFEDTAMRGLMINSILATDMGLHFKYMTDLGNLQEKLGHHRGIEGWSPQALDEYRTLICGLLIKCADISNVARPFGIAAAWADILQLEFANQGVMEDELGMSTTLFGGPPELGNLTKLANSQTGFMNIFACPLFEAVSDVLPSMSFAVDEMRKNQDMWKRKIEEQKAAGAKKQSFSSESLPSPRSRSPIRPTSQPELSHPEGLPASHTSSNILSTMSSPVMPEGEERRRASVASGPFRSSDPISQIHPQESQHPSSGVPWASAGSNMDPNASSRRSSGAFSAGPSMSQVLTTRRPSNTSPVQLQMTLGTDSRTQALPSLPAAENVQPGRRGSDGTLSHTNVSTMTSETGSRNVSIVGAGGSNARQGSKSSEGPAGDQSHSHQRPTAYSISKHSPYPALERHSSGGHTSRSQSVPYSPTETQATSVTEDSEDRNHVVHERGGSSTAKKGTPEVVDVDKPRNRHRLDGYGSLGPSKGMDIKTAVVNGAHSVHRSDTGRLVTRKSSRFLNFWKKRGKTAEPNS
ncbi:MAG: hypothetical protein Q9183_000128 [Haloplaca sp. 2 TL-2023]